MLEKSLTFQLLVVDDEQAVVNLLEEYASTIDFLEFHGFCSPQEALTWAKYHPVDIAVIDYNMPKMKGLDLISKLEKNEGDSYYLLMTGHAELQIAIDAIRTGVFDFITKPFKKKEFQIAMERVRKHMGIKFQNRFLRDLLRDSYGKRKLIGKSEEIISIREKMQLFAKSEAPVLITGETGVGKEVVAQIIHEAGNGNPNSFVPVNCSAYAETLLESELFGHEKGAFTGADMLRIGRFESAKNGTILLDEIAELPPQLQVKLLRVLQERKFERVGGNNTIELQARIISTTNRNIEEEIKSSRLREDFYYRLNTLRIHIPPLRERKKDILILANHFLRKFSLVHNKKVSSLDTRTQEILTNYLWPGNVRQLENSIDYAVFSCKMEQVSEEHLPEEILQSMLSKPSGGKEISKIIATEKTIPSIISNIERDKILASLDGNKWNKSKSASSLGISRGQLIYRLKKYGIKKE
ncbi:MAG TPA: sigma-54 dependent transcriptional regulator [Nitrospinota bacterium]|nr:sigma-54 dependent transcriptional regulator [Nitrospinota bacterium]|tara:strand:- start:164 stop:1567 length:1404 start_codon:yes stop_codon:yes gene_type:complete